MHTDRTTKFLLALIAAGIWVMILKPAFAPAPATAQAGPVDVNIAEVGGRGVTKPAIPVEGYILGRAVDVKMAK